MSLVSDTKASTSEDVNALTKLPDIELGSMNASQSISNHNLGLGDPFLEDFYGCALFDGHNLMNEPPPFKSQIQLLDICKGSSEQVYTCELRDSPFSTLKVQAPRDCLIRIMFIRKPLHYHFGEEFRRFSQQYSIPAAFWDHECSGSVGQRRTSSETYGKTNDTWWNILQKLSAGNAKTQGFRRACFLLKQHHLATNPAFPVPKITMICFNVPRGLRRRMHHAFNSSPTPSPETINGILADPFRLLLLVIMEWYQWNSKLFWALRNNLYGLEQVNGIRGTGLGHSDTAEYAYMHLVAKDLSQTEELLQFSLKMIGRFKALHEKSLDRQVGGDMLDAQEQTSAALDNQCSRFEGLMERVRALPKRMSNQVSLTFHLEQQRAAKTAQGSSDSVKTISILTLLFLPGTGIATIFSTQFIRPSDSSFKLTVAPSFVFYWILTIPITLSIMIFWFWWSSKQQPSTKDGALHPATPLPARKPSITNWKQWTSAKRSKDIDVEQRNEMHTRPPSPHFWHYTPSWPMPDGGSDGGYLTRDIDSEDE